MLVCGSSLRNSVHIDLHPESRTHVYTNMTGIYFGGGNTDYLN